MKKPEMKLKFSRRILNILVIFLICGTVLFAWQTVAKLQTKDDLKTEESKEKPVSIRSAGRGNPFVNFQDGKDLIVPNAANNQGAQPKVLASADFDSDGIHDFVTADVTGNLKFFKGNNLARSDAENPFTLTDKSFALNISPDFLFAGDFNADGRQDILATAKGTSFLTILSGDGHGNFSQPNVIAVIGQISALTAGEIGRKDGQTDVAVAFSNSKGAFLAVFEHPESAFKHKPELFKLPAPANEITIGNLDEDFYADIAVASGNQLTIIHGRGQAYPWDLIPQSGIQRPKAFVATRQMPFAISAMTVGRFSTKRGETLAILGADGNIYRLEPNRAEKPSNNKLKPEMLSNTKRNLFLPADAEVRNLAILTTPEISAEQAENGGKMLFDSNEISDGKFGEFLQKKQAEAAEKYKQMSKEEREKLLADALPKKAEFKERARQGYLRSIAGKPSTLANWAIETLVSDSSLASASASNAPNKMLKVNVSNSNLDDILLVDSITNQIRLVSQSKTENQSPKTEITNLEVESNLKAVLPMRLNLDALSDLVVLRENSSVPSVVMTTPMNIFFVTSDNEDGDCQGANLCSLRNAITLANQTPGVDVIFVSTDIGLITPLSPLPVITEGVTLAGQVNGNNQPLLEISGANMSGQGVDGLKIRTSNAAIYNLAVNEFTSIYDPDTGSSFGGNGITIESTTLSPNNGNNYVSGNYIGTDKTGSLDKGNGAAGLNIFDADGNQINNNIISGNGSTLVRGVGISVTAGNNNIFHGNIIGLNSLGTGKLGNTQGLFLTGANNDFGGDGAGQGNTVSGNGEPYPSPSTACYGFGMTIPPLISLDTAELLTLNNNIKGNRFGTNPAGTVGLGNCEKALSTGPLTQTIIGSITQTGRNIFSDNGYDAVYCGEFVGILGNASEGGFCAISGNNIGTDITGNIAIPNDRRNQLPGFIFATGAAEIQNNLSFSNLGAPGGTTPNGACTGFCNLISGNIGNFYAAGATGYGTVAVFNNFVGLNQNGNQALPNENTIGIASTSTFGETYIGLGVPNLTLGNIVAANGYANIDTGTGGGIGGLFQSAFVHGNFIGTDSSGTFSVEIEPSGFNYGNTGVTASSQFGDSVFIGAGNIEARNVIAGLKGIQNGAGAGIEVFLSTGSIKILNNLIGLNRSFQPLGNLGGGMRIFGPVGTNSVQIGGTDAEANQIAYNGSSGRNFAGVLINPGAQGVTVRNNLIHNNIGLGIDLNFSGTFYEGDGVTANDCQDTDFGANGLQNYPDLFAPIFNGDGTVTVNGVLRSTPRETFTIDFYASSDADPTNYGEGTNHIGSTTVTTSANGNVSFVFDSAEPVPSNYKITATATDENGNTSEFSCAAGVCFSLNGRTVEEAIEELGFTCLSPIVVNVTTDDADLDGDNPENTRDGFCDSDGDTPGPQCSLRAAIQEANARNGVNIIEFAIPGAGVQTIIPQSALPQITDGVRIYGSSQNDFGGGHLIKIDGIQTVGAVGLHLAASNSTIEGLTIVGFEKGIRFGGGMRNKIRNCYVGVNADGTTAPPNRMQIGIEISSGTQHEIGIAANGSGNVISNNLTGIQVIGGSGNTIVNNKIGLDSGGSSPLPNDNGIVIDGSNENKIGGDIASRNYISGNTQNGVILRNGAGNNQVFANFIGRGEPNVFGNGANGVLIENQAFGNIIGGTNQQEENIIVGHISTGAAGVVITNTAFSGNKVLNNYIGIQYGNFVAPNYYGVRVAGVGQFIGNQTGGGFAGNYIAGNLHSGVLVEDNNNFVIGNFIGTDGTDDLGNGEHGIHVTFANGTKIKNNLISGNDASGIYLANSNQTLITENKIGTNQNADAAIPNALQGIYVKGDENQIGDYNANQPNIISGNGQNGIYVETFSYSNKIFKNYVGVTAVVNGGQNTLGNTENGLRLYGYQTKVKGNVISDNAVGILVQRGAEDPEETNNQIEENLIGTDLTGELSFGNRDGGIILTNNTSQNIIGPRNVISGNGRNGIHIFSQSHDNIAFANIIGLNQVGSADNGNTDYGVFVEGYANKISQNVISGNGTGVRISRTPSSLGVTAAANNEFWGNKIGTNSDGTAAIGNDRSGIELTGGAVNNLIGGNLTTGNLVSGNGDGNGTNGRGIYIFTANTDDFDQTTDTPSANRVLGNYVGSNAAHDAAIPNQRSGILVFQSPNNIIGNNESPTAGSGNVVVGNFLHGIAVVGTEAIGNRVDYNYIGVTRDGTAIGNRPDGINIEQAPQTLIGNNNICGNEGSGIAVTNVNPQLTGISPNLDFGFKAIANNIGVFRNPDGSMTKISNAIGIELSNTLGGQIGGEGTKNIISGNDIGILVEGILSTQNTIKNSIIGTDENNSTGLGNGVGVKVNGANQTTIGDAQTFLRNIVKYNEQMGIEIGGTSAERNRVINSFVQQNGSHGVLLIDGARNNEVGGATENSGNLINNNNGAGVHVHPTAGHGNLVDPNSIFGNTGLGIDLGELGHTPNDSLDADTGANNLQNYPVITSQTIDGSGDLIVSYKVDSAPVNSDYGTIGLRIEFFKSDLSGEGELFLNADYYTVADYNSLLAPGVKTINLGNAVILGFGVNDKVTASTTDASGNTSEFFPPVFAPTAANVTIGGQVSASSGQGIGNVRVILTDSDGLSRTALTNNFGRFRFENVEVGQTYVISVANKKYIFEPSSQIVQIDDARDDLNFTASP